MSGVDAVPSSAPAVGALVDDVRRRLARGAAELTPHEVARALREAGRPVGDATVLEVYEQLRRDATGVGPLDPLVRQADVTDVLVNGTRGVYVDRGRGLEPTDVTFADEASVRRLAQRLCAQVGRRLDDAAPFADVRLTDGTRFHAVLAPIASPGTVISLRLPHRRPLALDELADPATAAVLRRIVACRLGFLISGGTGTGKTTLLAALLAQVPAEHRLVVVEDSAELRPPHPHLIGLEARPANIEGAGAVDLRTLVRQALRMRPDRLVVGEVRGAEVVDLLAAMNTGHEGGCGTLHANSALDVPARIEALALAAGLGRDAAHSQLASAVQVVLHLARTPDGGRRVAQIALPRRRADGLVEMEIAVQRDDDGRLVEGHGWAGLERLLADV